MFFAVRWLQEKLKNHYRCWTILKNLPWKVQWKEFSEGCKIISIFSITFWNDNSLFLYIKTSNVLSRSGRLCQTFTDSNQLTSDSLHLSFHDEISPSKLLARQMNHLFTFEKLTKIFTPNLQAYKHPEWRGPYLGPKPSEENRREFSEDVLRAGQTVIGLQAGTNKLANQSGQNFGASRKIILGKWSTRLTEIKEGLVLVSHL